MLMPCLVMLLTEMRSGSIVGALGFEHDTATTAQHTAAAGSSEALNERDAP